MSWLLEKHKTSMHINCQFSEINNKIYFILFNKIKDLLYVNLSRIVRWIKMSCYLHELTKVLHAVFFLREFRRYFRIV